MIGRSDCIPDRLRADVMLAEHYCLLARHAAEQGEDADDLRYKADHAFERAEQIAIEIARDRPMTVLYTTEAG